MKCARYNKPLPRVATAYLAEEYPLLFRRDDRSPIKTQGTSRGNTSPQDNRGQSWYAKNHRTVERRAILTDKALRTMRGRGHYFPPEYDPMAAADDDARSDMDGEAAPSRQSASRRRSRRSPSRSRAVETHFVVAPDAPPVPSLANNAYRFGKEDIPCIEISEPVDDHLTTAVEGLSLGTSRGLQKGFMSPATQGSFSGQFLSVPRPDLRRASSLSIATSVLIPDRFTIDSMLIERILAGPSRETIARYGEALRKSEEEAPAVPPSPAPSMQRSSFPVTKTRSRTKSRLGDEFRASAWEGSMPRDVWQTVRTLRNDGEEEDCRDKLLNRATAYSEF